MDMYIIRDREAGNIIDWFDSEEEAYTELEYFEREDEEHGNYTPDFYEVVKMHLRAKQF